MRFVRLLSKNRQKKSGARVSLRLEPEVNKGGTALSLNKNPFVSP